MLKMLLVAMVLFLAVAETHGKEIMLSAGMSRSDAVNILREIAVDLSPGLEVSAGPNGKPPVEFCWELKDYDLVVWLDDGGDGKILSIGFWTMKSFHQPKGDRYEQEKTARRITLDTEKHAYKVAPFPEYFPKEVLEKDEKRGLAPILFAADEPVLTADEKEKGYFAFRVLFFSADSRPDVAVRYETKGGRCYRRSVLLFRKSAGNAAESKEIEVPKKEAENLLASLEKSGFWKMPKDDSANVSQMPGMDNTGKDESRFIIEAIKDGEHRVRARRSPGYKTDERELSTLVRLYTKLFQETGVWKK